MALYQTKGTICDLSEVRSGVSKAGNPWQSMNVTVQIMGRGGSFTKQIFQAFGDSVEDVQRFKVGDKVEISWSMYAREYNGRWYNNVDLVKIEYQEGKQPEPTQAPAPKPQPKVQPAQDLFDPDAHGEDLPF